MKIAILIAALALAVSGCAHTLGYAGAHPGYVRCKGKGNITGTGHANVNAGLGGNELNTFTLQADCGDGFEFSQGRPADETPVGK